MPSSSSSTAVPEEIEQWLVLGKQALWVEDFSGTCQRECFCASCFHAFCTHCCWFHHEPTIHMVFPVAADAAGRGVYATHGPDGCRVHPDFVEDVLAAQDYATRLPWDAFCLLCGTALCRRRVPGPPPPPPRPELARRRPPRRAARRAPLRALHGVRVVVPLRGTDPGRPGGGRRRRAASPGDDEETGQLQAVRRPGHRLLDRRLLQQLQRELPKGPRRTKAATGGQAGCARSRRRPSKATNRWVKDK
ncbi:hypothetical protein OsJ_00673 [Oryza sativa Japonica Group]|uniref:Uncharacterized protein n=1 Tax=Oryza sativa subsp. japonica TaxID=39947 RepID=B9ETJ4_ORYSJ|nr:hypothetical protein OsJ_00673 [Oryza sativa Japonica Group]